MKGDFFNTQTFFQHLGIKEDEQNSLLFFSRSLIHNNTDGVIGYDNQFKVILWNSAIAQISGYTEEQALGENIFDLLPFFIKNGSAFSLEKVFRGQSMNAPDAEYHIPKTNKAGFYSAKVFPVFNNQQQICGGLIIFSTITDRKLAEDKVKASLHFIDKALNTLSHAVYVYDLEQKKLIYTNQHVGSILKVANLSSEANGNEIINRLVHPEDHIKILERQEQILKLADGEVHEIEIRVRTSKNEWHWHCLTSTTFKRDQSGGVIQTIQALQDIHDRKEAELFLSKIISNTPHGILVLKPTCNENQEIFDFLVVLRNNEIRKFSSFEDEEVIGHSILKLYPDIQKVGLDKVYMNTMISGEPFQLEYELPLNGGKGWLKTSGVKMGDYLLVTVENLTEKKSFERELQETNNKLLDAQQLAIMGTYEWIIEKNQLIWTPSLYDIFELDPVKTVLSINVFKRYVHPNDLSSVEKLIQEFIQNPENKSQEYRIVTPSGKVKYLKSLMKPAFHTDGSLYKMIGYAQDISGLKEQALLLQESNALLQQAQDNLQVINDELTERVKKRTKEIEEKNVKLEQLIKEFKFVTDFMPQMVWATQPDGYHDFYNKRWYEFTGLTYEETKDKGWSQVLHPDDYERTWKVWKESLATGKMYEIEYRMRKYDGTYTWFLARAMPLINNKGQIRKWFGTCTDIQEHQRIYNELSETKEKLSEVNESLNLKNKHLERINVELDNFVYTASHDLKAPLNNIEGILTLLTKSCRENPRQEKLIDMVDFSLKRFKATISDLTAIAESTKEKNDVTEVNLEEVIVDVEKDIECLIESNNSTIINSLEIKIIRYSRKDIRSLLYNLLSNAVKYRSPDRPSKVEIRSRKENEFIVIEVEDNGLGLKSEDIPKVFQKYHRIYTHTEGSGIGMFILKRMIECAGGKIEIESTEGKGSLFRTYLRME